MLVEVVSVVLRAPRDSTSEDSMDLSLLVLEGQRERRQNNEYIDNNAGSYK